MGAGPAGSTCAQVLGEAGVKVALFDPSHPREKPCGGLIDYRVVEEFDIPEGLLENEVKWVLAERFGFRAKLFIKPSAYLISRKIFDHHLLKRALKNRSVTFFRERVVNVSKDEDKWVIKTNNDRHIKVKVIIGADGCPSLTRKCVLSPIPRKFLATTVGYNFCCSNENVKQAFAKNTIELYYSRKYIRETGFIWIFPKKTSVNVGIGGIEQGKNLRQSLDNFIALNPFGKRLKSLKGKIFSHLLPVIWDKAFFKLSCTGDNWALIGDAAGHVEPINGVGIYYAMKGGALCALAFLDGDLKLFEKYWRSYYGNELHSGSKNFTKFYGNLAFFTWLRYLSENVLLQLGDFAHGIISHLSIYHDEKKYTFKQNNYESC